MDALRTELGQIHAAHEQQAAQVRTHLDLIKVRGDFAKTMSLLRAVKSGAVRLEQVVIDGDNWQVLDPTQVPVVLEDGEGAP